MKKILAMAMAAMVAGCGADRGNMTATGTIAVGDPASEMVEIMFFGDDTDYDSVNFWVDTNGLLNIELDGVTLTEGATLFINEIGRQTGNAVRFVTTVATTTTTTTTLPIFSSTTIDCQ